MPVTFAGLVLHRVGEPFIPGSGVDTPKAQGIGGDLIPPVEVVQLHTGGVGDVLKIIPDGVPGHGLIVAVLGDIYF